MHPMTIKLLSRVAENYAASQRTMFRFMKDQSNSEHGFVGYINKEGPDSQACWLTPEWLWDYFFTRESDFSDKDTKAAEYIRHYEESRHLVENDENAHRVFKTAMLLLALMSSTKGIYSGRRAKDGIAATKDCLETCLAGVMGKTQIEDMLQTMVDGKILVLDEGSNNIVRIQLPFRGAGDTDFTARLAANDKKYSRYMMFSKDGAFAQAFEKQAWDANDATLRRMKIAVCCAETNSINTRLGEITKELEKCPYKLGLLIVTVQSDAQAVSIQSVLQAKAAETSEPRLTIALVKTPLTDENRTKWLTAITKQEMASDSGQTGSVQHYRMEASTIISSWVGGAVSGGKIIAYNGNKGSVEYGDHRAVITSEFEHHAILRACAKIETLGYPVVYLRPNKEGFITPDNLKTTISDQTKLVSIMMVNNEIGTIQPIKELCNVAHNHGAVFHTDAVQALGHIPVDVKALGIDMMSCSAHKFNGPKGVGFLFIKKGTNLSAYADGGAQEFGLRAGTENVASIVGMSVALQKNVARLSDFQSRLLSLEQVLTDKLNSAAINYRRNGTTPRVPGNLSLSFPYADGEAILHRLDLMGIMVSTGSACDSKNTQISHVLHAINADELYAKGTVRISLGKDNTVNEAEKIADAIIKIVSQKR